MRIFTRLLTFFSFAFLLAACSPSSPEAVAEKFFREAFAGNADAVIAMYDMADLSQEAGMKEVAEGKIKSAAAKRKQQADEWGGIAEIRAGRAEPKTGKDGKKLLFINVEIRFKNGKNKQERVKLVETSGGWKVSP